MKFRALFPALIAASVLGIAGCNDSTDSSDDSSDVPEESTPSVDVSEQTIFATSQDIGSDDLIFIRVEQRPIDFVLLATEEGKDGRGGFFLWGDMLDGRIEILESFGEAAGLDYISFEEEDRGYSFETPHGDSRTVTVQNFNAIDPDLQKMDGQWTTEEGSLLQVNYTEVGGIESLTGELELGTSDGTCNTSGGINHHDGLGEINHWNFDLAADDYTSTCTIDGYPFQVSILGYAFVTAPDGVSSTNRELVMLGYKSGSLMGPARMLLRFSR